MREVDTLKIKRRQLEVEINRLNDKLQVMVEDKKMYDRRINVLLNDDPTNNKNFATISGLT